MQLLTPDKKVAEFLQALGDVMRLDIRVKHSNEVKSLAVCVQAGNEKRIIEAKNESSNTGNSRHRIR